MSQAVIIQKYGGSAVSSTERILAIAEHIKWTRETTGKSLVVAISAMGDQTDELLELAAEISGTPPKRELDMLLSAGERISMALLAIALDNFGVSTISLTGSQSGILTDEYHGNARISKVLGDRIRKGITDGHVVIVAGFQGVSPKTKDITTLGRGGTDLTAVALAATLDASQCELYKDVAGILHCDPKLSSNPRLQKNIPWEVMTELAWSGANVLNPRAAHLAQKLKVRLLVNAFSDPKNIGTEIYGDAKMESVQLVGISTKPDQSLLKLSPDRGKDFSEMVNWLWSNDETPLINALDQGQIIFSLKSNLVDGLKAKFKISDNAVAETECEILTVGGAGFLQSPETVGKFMEILLPAKPYFVQYSNTTLRAALDASATKSIVQKIDQQLFAGN